MMADHTIPVRSDVAWRNIDGNVIVVRPQEGILYPLNSVATKIWLLSDGTRRVSEIVVELLEEFDGQEDQMRKDAFLFLGQLEKASLIKTNQGALHGI